MVSQRDFRTPDALRERIDSTHERDPGALDHHQTPWYRSYFGADWLTSARATVGTRSATSRLGIDQPWELLAIEPHEH